MMDSLTYLFPNWIISCLTDWLTSRYIYWQVTGVSLTPGDDQLLVVHLEHNDLVVCLFNESKANRVAELMANLYLQIYE